MLRSNHQVPGWAFHRLQTLIFHFLSKSTYSSLLAARVPFLRAHLRITAGGTLRHLVVVRWRWLFKLSDLIQPCDAALVVGAAPGDESGEHGHYGCSRPY